MKKITAPVPRYNESIGEVSFSDSVAYTDNESVISYCERVGYLVEDVESQTEEAEGDETGGTTEGQTGNDSGEALRPGGNASLEEWTEFALANGKTEDDLDGLKRNEIIALFDNDDE